MVPMAALMVAALLGGQADAPAPDVVRLVNGRSAEGRVVYEDAQELVLRVGSRDRVYDQEDVESVTAVLRELPEALDLISALGGAEISKRLEVAEDLEERNLPGEARLVYWQILSIDPDDDVANERLGHRRRGKSWVIPHSGRWYRLKDLERLTTDWGKAWELRTTHFAVRSNLPLRQVTDAAVDLERIYRAFYRTFGPELQLHEVVEPMEAWIHADEASFSAVNSTSPGYFSPADNRLIINASSGLHRSTLVHEATHQLLFNTAVNTKGGTGRIPGWLNEGLAEYMEVSFSGRPGQMVLAPGEPHGPYLATHAAAPKPYRLNRVLNFQSNDFHGSSKQHLKYAQAYSLVQFCLHADGGAYRGGFLTFVLGAFDGKASSTHFKKAIGVKEKDLEEAWHEYARSGGVD